MKTADKIILSLVVVCLVLCFIMTILLSVGILQGIQGPAGEQGEQGGTGSAGKTAFEIFKESYRETYGEDYPGTEKDWLESLKGDRGAVWFQGNLDPNVNEVEGAVEGDFYLFLHSALSDYKGFIIYTLKDGKWEKVMEVSVEKTDEEKGNLEDVEIYSAADLAAFRSIVDSGNKFNDKTVTLMANIDLKNEPWTPINNFYGTFDGNGYTISNLNVTADNAGLFGISADNSEIKAHVKDLTIEHATVTGTKSAGAIFGWLKIGSLTNCHVTGLVKIEGNKNVGGLVGYTYASISNCSVEAETGSYVKGVYNKDGDDTEGDNVGGLIGWSGEGSSTGPVAYTTTDVKVTGVDVAGTRKVGGVVGYLSYGTGVDKAYFSGTVTCNANDESYIAKEAHRLAVGGIVGETHSYSGVKNSTIENSTINVIFAYTYENIDNRVIGNVRDSNVERAKTVEEQDNEVKNTVLNSQVKNATWDKYGSANYVKTLDIETEDDLLTFARLHKAGVIRASNINNRACVTTVNIVNDLNFEGRTWTPMDLHDVVFDGGESGHKISNIDMGKTNEKWGGFVTRSNSVGFKNLTFENVTVSGSQAGVLAGNWMGSAYSMIENVTLAGDINVSYASSAETYGGIGIFTGVISEGTLPVTNAKIAEGAVVKIDFTGISFENGAQKTDNYYFGYSYGGNTQGTVTKADSAQISYTAEPQNA